MKDGNVCEHCELLHDLAEPECASCGQPLVLDTSGAVAVWRLGDLEGGLLDL